MIQLVICFSQLEEHVVTSCIWYICSRLAPGYWQGCRCDEKPGAAQMRPEVCQSGAARRSLVPISSRPGLRDEG